MSHIFNIQHCPPNPSLDYAESIEVPFGTTKIVSKGGGSTIDVGKWVARKYGLKHYVIPTTTGTGSEATKYCVLTVNGKKVTFVDDKFLPECVIFDPTLTTTLNKIQTMSGAYDALSQALESMWNKEATEESKLYSEVAIRLITQNLDECLNNPTNERARMDMLLGAHFSGKAINISPTNICHAISYPLTEIYKIPHGLACGMSLKYFAQKALGIDLSSVLRHLPKFEIDAEKIADIAIKHPKVKGFPHKITKLDILTSLL